MASSSAAVIIQPQVNSRIRRGEDSVSRCLTSSWLAPAPSTRTRIFRRNRAGTCRIAAASTSLWSVNVFEPGVAGAQQHRQALARIRSPGPQRVEAVAFLPGGSRSLLVRVRGDQGGVHVDDQPARQGLPGDDQPREPGGRLLDQLPHVRPGLARARAIRSSRPGSPARSRARRTVGPLGAAPSTGASCASTAISLMLVAPSAIATAIDTSATPRSNSGDVPARRSAALSAAVSPAWSASLRSRTAPACPTRPVPSRGDLQGMVPAVMLHGEERSSPGNYVRVVTA